MKDHGFRKVMSGKTSAELLDIITNQRSEYHANALLDAQAILEEQGVALQLPSAQTSSSMKAEQPVSYPYAPFLTALGFIAFAFYQPSHQVSYQQALEMNIFVNVLMRVIVLLWSYSLANKFKLHKPLWMILGLLFGGWSLLAIAVTCWIKATPEKDSDTLFTSHS